MHFHLLLVMRNESERLDYSVMEACWVVFCLLVPYLLAFFTIGEGISCFLAIWLFHLCLFTVLYLQSGL